MKNKYLVVTVSNILFLVGLIIAGIVFASTTLNSSFSILDIGALTGIHLIFIAFVNFTVTKSLLIQKRISKAEGIYCTLNYLTVGIFIALIFYSNADRATFIWDYIMLHFAITLPLILFINAIFRIQKISNRLLKSLILIEVMIIIFIFLFGIFVSEDSSPKDYVGPGSELFNLYKRQEYQAG